MCDNISKRRVTLASRHDDISKRYRSQPDLDMVLDEGEIYLKANGVTSDREKLKRILPA